MIAQQIRLAITSSGQTVTAIARACGVPQPVLWRFMKLKRDITLRTAQKLLDHFNIDPFCQKSDS